MVSDQIDFTLEGILAIHREWILKLYLEDRKTEAEITLELASQKLIITPEQVQKCIQDWNLQPLALPPPPIYHSMPELEQHSSSYTTSHPPRSTHTHKISRANPKSTPRIFNSPLHNSQTTKTPCINLHITPINPTNQDLYNNRPLPRIPQHPSTSQSSTESTSSPPPQDCIHGYPPSECLELHFGLECLSNTGPSSLDLYTDTAQFHEKIAVSLSRDEDQREREVLGPIVHVVDTVALESGEDDDEEDAVHELSYTRAKDLVWGRRKDGRVEVLKRVRHRKECKRKRVGSGEGE